MWTDAIADRQCSISLVNKRTWLPNAQRLSKTSPQLIAVL